MSDITKRYELFRWTEGTTQLAGKPMAPHVIHWQGPPIMEPGAPQPSLLLGKNGDLYCAYRVSTGCEDLSLGEVAVLRFQIVLFLRFGYPGDEVLDGHALYKSGLEHYQFHVVEDSPLIADIEVQDRIHPRHEPGMYRIRFKHFVATFHDETLEVVAERGLVAGRTNLPPHKAVVTSSQSE